MNKLKYVESVLADARSDLRWAHGEISVINQSLIKAQAEIRACHRTITEQHRLIVGREPKEHPEHPSGCRCSYCTVRRESRFMDDQQELPLGAVS